MKLLGFLKPTPNSQPRVLGLAMGKYPAAPHFVSRLVRAIFLGPEKIFGCWATGLDFEAPGLNSGELQP